MSSFLKPKTKKISVIILNFNGGEDLLKTLSSVVESDCENLEIILVDNGSTDNSVNLAKKKFPQIISIQNKKNLGFGAGNNVGIKFAFENGADCVFLLNNDALIQTRRAATWRGIQPSAVSSVVASPCSRHSTARANSGAAGS